MLFNACMNQELIKVHKCFFLLLKKKNLHVILGQCEVWCKDLSNGCKFLLAKWLKWRIIHVLNLINAWLFPLNNKLPCLHVFMYFYSGYNIIQLAYNDHSCPFLYSHLFHGHGSTFLMNIFYWIKRSCVEPSSPLRCFELQRGIQSCWNRSRD